MAGTKETYQVHLNPDQMSFVRSLNYQFSFSEEIKTIRIIVDNLISDASVHDAIFSQKRCLRCE